MNSITVQKEKIFNVKHMGNGCRFAIKVSSKKQEGGFTRGVFINCVYRKGVLNNGGMYDMSGFLADNEWQDKNSLEFVVQEATQVGQTQSTPAHAKMPQNNIPAIDIDSEEIPF